MMQLIMFVRKLKWVTSTIRVQIDFREASASSVFPTKLIRARLRRSDIRNPTFDFGFQELQELLVNSNEALFPFTKPRNGLPNLL